MTTYQVFHNDEFIGHITVNESNVNVSAGIKLVKIHPVRKMSKIEKWFRVFWKRHIVDVYPYQDGCF